jgi:hypothetical protein
VNITKAQLDAINKGLLDKFGIPDSPMPNSLLADLVIGVAQRLVDALKEDMRQKKLKATGNLIGETKVVDFQETPNGVTVPIEMASYYLWADQGRGRTRQGNNGGKFLWQSIEEWITAKGIPVRKSRQESGQSVLEARKSMAVAIAKKIHSRGTIKRFGYKGGNFIGDVLTPANIDAIAQHLGDALGKPITAYVTSEIATT